MYQQSSLCLEVMLTLKKMKYGCWWVQLRPSFSMSMKNLLTEGRPPEAPCVDKEWDLSVSPYFSNQGLTSRESLRSGLMEIWDIKFVSINLLLKSLVLISFIAMIGKDFEEKFCCRPCLLQKTPHNLTSKLHSKISFNSRLFFWVSLPFFLNMVVDWLIDITTPRISTT